MRLTKLLKSRFDRIEVMQGVDGCVECLDDHLGMVPHLVIFKKILRLIISCIFERK